MTWYLVAPLLAITEVRRFLWLATGLHTWRDCVLLLFANPLQVIQVSRLTFGNSNLQLPDFLRDESLENTASWVDVTELDLCLIWPQHFHPVLLWIIGKLQTACTCAFLSRGASFWQFNIRFWWDWTNFIKKIIIRKKERRTKKKKRRKKLWNLYYSMNGYKKHKIITY